MLKNGPFRSYQQFKKMRYLFFYQAIFAHFFPKNGRFAIVADHLFWIADNS